MIKIIGEDDNEIIIYLHPEYSDYGCDMSGNVYSFKGYGGISVRKMKPTKRKDKHCDRIDYVVILYKDGKPKFKLVSHVVFECVTNRLYKFSTKSRDGLTIDHDNNNPLNNRFSNLKLMTLSNNVSKQGKNKYKYIHWHKASNKWRFQIRENGKLKHFGLFSTIEEALEARKKYCDENGIKI